MCNTVTAGGRGEALFYLESLLMTRISAPFSSFSLWLSDFKSGSVWKREQERGGLDSQTRMSAVLLAWLWMLMFVNRCILSFLSLNSTSYSTQPSFSPKWWWCLNWNHRNDWSGIGKNGSWTRTNNNTIRSNHRADVNSLNIFLILKFYICSEIT